MTGTYDRIARFYDVDMSRNMAFDDVGFYARQCAGRAGAVLEMGCGNGRILLPLLARGLDMVGADASAGMLDELARKARAAALPVRIARMDVRRLAFRPGFATILCPYSLVTYMVGDDDAPRMLAEVRRLLAPDGVFVVDAFVPRPLVAHDGFRQDYARPYADGTLVREKRVRPVDASRNHIERRYRFVGADGTVRDEVTVAETIRPFDPPALRAAVTAAGLVPCAEWWDYGERATAEGAQFFALAAKPR
ncbi:MAG: class I SAM-dependent methyltransferase [Burkholderiales bacterium]